VTVHHGDHAYRAVVRWEGSTGLGYSDFERAHEVACPPAGPPLSISADPAFRGDGGLLNPEQLLLAAAASCQLLSFLAAAARARVDVVAYTDEATAIMAAGDLPLRITAITLRPHISVRRAADGLPSEERVRHLVEVGHRECYIANSLTAAMTIEATVAWVAGAR